jgi:hypothetical protein
MMTPEQVQRTMDFILQSMANATIRAEQFDEDMRRFRESQEVQKTEIEDLKLASRDLLESSRNTIERTNQIEDILKTLAQIVASQSIRLAWLEDKHS